MEDSKYTDLLSRVKFRGVLLKADPIVTAEDLHRLPPVIIHPGSDRVDLQLQQLQQSVHVRVRCLKLSVERLHFSDDGAQELEVEPVEGIAQHAIQLPDPVAVSHRGLVLSNIKISFQFPPVRTHVLYHSPPSPATWWHRSGQRRS